MKKQFKGTVTSTKMEKTAKVAVERFWEHPLYKKRIKKIKNYLVDDQIGVSDGDRVVIEECRPISKRKKFKIIKILNGEDRRPKTEDR